VPLTFRYLFWCFTKHCVISLLLKDKPSNWALVFNLSFGVDHWTRVGNPPLRRVWASLGWFGVGFSFFSSVSFFFWVVVVGFWCGVFWLGFGCLLFFLFFFFLLLVCLGLPSGRPLTETGPSPAFHVKIDALPPKPLPASYPFIGFFFSPT